MPTRPLVWLSCVKYIRDSKLGAGLKIGLRMNEVETSMEAFPGTRCYPSRSDGADTHI